MKTFSQAEHEELVRFSEIIESADVRRLELMVELAQLRGTGLREIRKELGIADSVQRCTRRVRKNT